MVVDHVWRRTANALAVAFANKATATPGAARAPTRFSQLRKQGIEQRI